MVVLDSTFLIDFLKGKKRAVEKMGKLDRQKLFTTRLNVFEILVGIYRKEEKTQEELLAFNRLLDSIQIFELDQHGGNRAAQISAELIKQGKMVADIDILISAIAITNNHPTIITENIKDFEKIPGIKIEKY